jgi:hypothetical protein
LKQKFSKLILKRKLKNLYNAEFITNLKDKRKVSQNNTKIITHMRYKINYKLFVNRLKSINFIKKTISNNFELRKISYATKISNLFQRSFMKQLIMHSHKLKLKRSNLNMSNFLSYYFKKLKIFKSLKKNYFQYLENFNKSHIYYSKLISKKIFNSFNINLEKRQKIKKSIDNYNESNLVFLNLILNKLKLEIRLTNQNMIYNNIHPEFSKLNLKFHQLFYINPVRTIFKTLKNYYLKKVIIYTKLAKLSFYLKFIKEANNKMHTKSYIKSKLLMKKINKYEYSKKIFYNIYRNYFYYKFKKEAIEKTFKMNQKSHLLNFVSKVLDKSNYNHKKILNYQEYRNKFKKLKFMEFIYRLHLKKQKSQENSASAKDNSMLMFKSIKSPSNIIKQNKIKFHQFQKDLIYYFYITKLVNYNKTKKGFYTKLFSFKKRILLKKEFRFFFHKIQRNIKYKLHRRSKLSNFFFSFKNGVTYSLKIKNKIKNFENYNSKNYVLKHFISNLNQHKFCVHRKIITDKISEKLKQYLFSKFLIKSHHIKKLLSTFNLIIKSKINIWFVQKILKLSRYQKLKSKINKSLKQIHLKILSKIKKFNNKCKNRTKKILKSSIQNNFGLMKNNLLHSQIRKSLKIRLINYNYLKSLQFICYYIIVKKILNYLSKKFYIKSLLISTRKKINLKNKLQIKGKNFRIWRSIKFMKSLINYNNEINNKYRKIARNKNIILIKKFFCFFKIVKIVDKLNKTLNSFKYFYMNKLKSRLMHLNKFLKFKGRRGKIYFKYFMIMLICDASNKKDYTTSAKRLKYKHFLNQFLGQLVVSLISKQKLDKLRHFIWSKTFYNFKKGTQMSIKKYKIKCLFKKIERGILISSYFFLIKNLKSLRKIKKTDKNNFELTKTKIKRVFFKFSKLTNNISIIKKAYLVLRIIIKRNTLKYLQSFNKLKAKSKLINSNNIFFSKFIKFQHSFYLKNLSHILRKRNSDLFKIKKLKNLIDLNIQTKFIKILHNSLFIFNKIKRFANKTITNIFLKKLKINFYKNKIFRLKQIKQKFTIYTKSKLIKILIRINRLFRSKENYLKYIIIICSKKIISKMKSHFKKIQTYNKKLKSEVFKIIKKNWDFSQSLKNYLKEAE